MMQDFLNGMTAYAAAVRHVRAYRMWGYVLLPGLLTVLIGGGVFWAAWAFSDDIGGVLSGLWPWDWGREVMQKASQILGGLLLLLLGLIFFKQIVMVLLSPFMSILSEKVEKQLRGDAWAGTSLSVPQILSDMVRGLRIAVRNIIRELLLTLLLLLLGLVPLFSPFTAILIFVVQSYYAGFGNLDFALERHYRYADSVRFVQRNRALALGNGAVFMLLLFTFAGFLVALPLGTVAATIETVKRVDGHLVK